MSLQPGLPSFSRSCLLLFTPLCHCCSVSSAPFPSICSSFSPLWLCLSYPLVVPWIHAFHVGTFESISQSSELSLCLPNCDVSVCAETRSEWTRRGSKKTTVSKQAVIISDAPLSLFFPPFSLSSLLRRIHHDPSLCIVM